MLGGPFCGPTVTVRLLESSAWCLIGCASSVRQKNSDLTGLGSPGTEEAHVSKRPLDADPVDVGAFWAKGACVTIRHGSAVHHLKKTCVACTVSLWVLQLVYIISLAPTGLRRIPRRALYRSRALHFSVSLVLKTRRRQGTDQKVCGQTGLVKVLPPSG